RDETLVLETEFETADGVAAVIDFMPAREQDPNLVRIVEGRRGTVRMRSGLIIRFDYGSIVPWVRPKDLCLSALPCPDSLTLLSPVPLRGENLTTVAEFAVAAGERVPFSMSWHPSHRTGNHILDASTSLADTEAWWHDWISRCSYEGPYREPVVRSLMTL